MIGITISPRNIGGQPERLGGLGGGVDQQLGLDRDADRGRGQDGDGLARAPDRPVHRVGLAAEQAAVGPQREQQREQRR